MRVDAHPLVVAVALGLLAPSALESDEDGIPEARARVQKHPLDGECRTCREVEAGCDAAEAAASEACDLTDEQPLG